MPTLSPLLDSRVRIDFCTAVVPGQVGIPGADPVSLDDDGTPGCFRPGRGSSGRGEING